MPDWLLGLCRTGSLQNIGLLPEQKSILHLFPGDGECLPDGFIGQGFVAVPQQVQQYPEGVRRCKL